MARDHVTGGAGFPGSHLLEALAVAGHEVRVPDDLSSTAAMAARRRRQPKARRS